jgi:Resolvase, N terminal domain
MFIGYARVSKLDRQDTRAQVKALKEAGCKRIFHESASGGALGVLARTLESGSRVFTEQSEVDFFVGFTKVCQSFATNDSIEKVRALRGIRTSRSRGAFSGDTLSLYHCRPRPW